ncbi:hypothetical protein BC962_3112 [Gillisia mitskevichiae]|uniref:Uncharacterized protein n=1 Tax=Gillisia mitskevichiae TaxID=270921 RepID=A0A495NYI5_9FLAO|nr:hypothetical protein [Gillisia mitskevichiae]RKS42825.1 hypothetical protein BC962_3112 [Gillisia mitskevichiae]
MKNQLLRIIAVAVVASLVIISWMKSRSETNADYETNKVEIRDSQEGSSSQVSYISVDEVRS